MLKFIVKIIYFFLFLISVAFANEPIALNNQISELVLDSHCEHFIDNSNSLSLEQIQNANFLKPLNTHLALGFTKSAVWFKCHFKIPLETPAHWWLKIDPPALQNIELFYPDGPKLTTGSSIFFSERPFKSVDNLFQVITKNNSEEIYYLKIKSITTMSPTLTLYNPSHFVDAQFKSIAIKGILLGVLILILIIILTLTIILKDASLISFLLSSIFSVLLYLNLTGWSQAIFFRSSPSGYILFHGFFISAMYGTLLWSFYDLMNTKLVYPKFYRVIYWSGWGIILLGCSSFFGKYYGIPNNIVRLTSYILSLPAIYLIGKELKTNLQKRYVLHFIALVIFIVSVGIGIINGFGVIAIGGAATYIPQIGIILYMVTATIGLIFKFREIDIERRRLADYQIQTNKILSEIGHEIRTPLNAIQNLARLSFAQTDQIERDKKMMNIYQSTRSVLDVANTLLDFSQINDKKIIITPITFSIKEVIRESVSLFAPLAKEKNLKFIHDIDRNVPEVFYSDPVRIKQILNNILTNAIKYTNAGEIKLALLIFHNQLHIKVTNSNDKSISSPGAGIGLVISRSLAKLLEGSLEFSSSNNIFTTDFILPIKSVPPISNEPNHTLFGETWIIEDNPLNLEIIESAVRAAGLNYRSFLIAEDALLYFKQNSPNLFLAIIDINLQTTTGMDVAEKLYQKSPKTYFIAYTGESWNSISNWITTSRFQTVWTKPLNFEHAVLELNSLKLYYSSIQDSNLKIALIDLIHPRMADSFRNKEMITTFLLKTHESIRETIDLLEKMNIDDKLKNLQTAHKLKGTAAQLSNPTLENLAIELESFIKNDLHDEVKIRIPGLRFQTEQFYQLILKLS